MPGIRTKLGWSRSLYRPTASSEASSTFVKSRRPLERTRVAFVIHGDVSTGAIFMSLISSLLCFKSLSDGAVYGCLDAGEWLIRGQPHYYREPAGFVWAPARKPGPAVGQLCALQLESRLQAALQNLNGGRQGKTSKAMMRTLIYHRLPGHSFTCKIQNHPVAPFSMASA